MIITLGTGLGVSAVIEGRVLRGVHGQGGILAGHITLRHAGPPCGCGNIGCAEAEASTSVLKRLAKEQPGFVVSALAKEPVLDYLAANKMANEAAGHTLQPTALVHEAWLR